MASTSSKPELVAIVGPTASGKSELALRVAQNFRGEIIAADSRTIYKGMDIGTAKTSHKDQKLVPHWGINLIEPGHNYSAAQFKKYTETKIKEIQNRANLPILVGGTGLYLDSILFDFQFPEISQPQQRIELEKLELEQLQDLIRELGYDMPDNRLNRRHLIRTIEREGQTGSKRPYLRPGTVLIGLMHTDKQLRQRIDRRAEEIFKAGVGKETDKLLEKYGQNAILKTGGIVYKICLRLLKGEISEDEAVELFKKADWQYARRQKTWFRRNKFIRWFSSSDKAYQEISAILNK